MYLMLKGHKEVTIEFLLGSRFLLYYPKAKHAKLAVTVVLGSNKTYLGKK